MLERSGSPVVADWMLVAKYSSFNTNCIKLLRFVRLEQMGGSLKRSLGMACWSLCKTQHLITIGIIPKILRYSCYLRNPYLNKSGFPGAVLSLFGGVYLERSRMGSEPALNIVEGINCAEGSEPQLCTVFSQSEIDIRKL